MKNQSDLLYKPFSQLDASESSSEPTAALSKSKQNVHCAPTKNKKNVRLSSEYSLVVFVDSPHEVDVKWYPKWEEAYFEQS
jgi:hypothetical protein